MWNYLEKEGGIKAFFSGAFGIVYKHISNYFNIWSTNFIILPINNKNWTRKKEEEKNRLTYENFTFSLKNKLQWIFLCYRANDGVERK